MLVRFYITVSKRGGLGKGLDRQDLSEENRKFLVLSLKGQFLQVSGSKEPSKPGSFAPWLSCPPLENYPSLVPL